MYPLVRIDLLGWHYDLATYSLFLSLAGMVAVSMGWRVAVRRGTQPGRAALCVVGIGVSIITGARLLDVATKARLYEAGSSSPFHTSLSGFSMYGGLLLALPTAVVLCRVLSIDLAHMADSLTPAAGAGIAIAKVGCFLAGCCFGIPAALPWAVTFPFGSEAHLYQLIVGSVPVGRGPLPVHPSELYEAVAAIAGTIAATWLLGRRSPRGVSFLGFALWFTAFRLLDEPFRAPSLAFTAPSWFYSALYSGIVLLSGALLLRRLANSGCESPAGRGLEAGQYPPVVGGVQGNPAVFSNSAGIGAMPAAGVGCGTQAARRSST